MPKVVKTKIPTRNKWKKLTLDEALEKAEDKLRRNGEPDIETEMVNLMAKEMADEIDKMLLEKIKNTTGGENDVSIRRRRVRKSK